MDFSKFLPEGVTMHKYYENGQLTDENRRLKERIQSHALEMQQLAKEIFTTMVNKTRLDASIKATRSVASKLSEVLKTRLQQQNRLVHMLKDEKEKQKVLQRRAEETQKRVMETKMRIADNRKRVDTLGDYAMKIHDSMQLVSIEITTIEEDMRRYRAKEGELVKLNVTLANAESELKEINSAIKESEFELNALGMCKVKCQEEIDASFRKLKEFDELLNSKMNEKFKLQKLLDGLSIKTDIKRLDDIDVTLERHNSVISEIKLKHQEAMQSLRDQMKEAVEKNDAFQRVITELDGALAEQHQELDRAKEEFEKLTVVVAQDDNTSCSAENKSLLHELEVTKCTLNQTEEEIMHFEHQLGIKKKATPTTTRNARPKDYSRRPEAGDNNNMINNDSTILSTSMRTSTPEPATSMASNSSFTSNMSTIAGDATEFNRVRNQRMQLQTLGRSRRTRSNVQQHDDEVSSTNGDDDEGTMKSIGKK